LRVLELLDHLPALSVHLHGWGARP
jgi:hypothetical protein